MSNKKLQDQSFLSLVYAPAKRALEKNGIDTLEKLAKFTEKEILQFHGIGKSAIPKLANALKAKGLSFKR
ncbi:hypothetical protein GZH53_04150 [Flavihumibacter sp. R14]|nr:hypothetical protein [Flavihumibacter soli]